MRFRLFSIFAFLLLLIALAQGGTYVLPSNSLSGSFGPWGGTGHFYTPTFNVDATGGIDIIYYDIDLSQLRFGNTWELKGYAEPGVSAASSMPNIDPLANSVWGVFHNQEIAAGTDWNGNSISTLGPDGLPNTNDDTRHGSIQDWYRAASGGKINGPGQDIAHNNESYETPNSRFPSAPIMTPSELNTYDFRLRILPTGSGTYTYEMWTRMHNAASNVEGCTWCNCGTWNHAINNCGESSAWRALEYGGSTVFSISGFDLSAVYVFMGLANGNTASSQALTWGKIEVTGTPTSTPTVVWVDDNYYAGGTNDGHVWGYDAFATIDAGIGAVAANGTVNVAAGTYDETLTLNKSLTLNGANADVACDSRGAESIIAPASGLPVSITADGVTINGFEVTAPSYQNAIVCGNTSDLTIVFNNIHHIGSSLSDTYVHAIHYNVANSPAATSNVTFSDNCFSNIGNLSNNKGSASAVGVLQSTSTGTLTNLNIERNSISNVYSKTADWGDGGRIAYGIIINTGSANYQTTDGKVVNAVIKNNTLSDFEGFISTGIGLEGNTENAVFENNTISNLIGYKLADRSGGGYDLNALKFETNRYIETVTVQYNSFKTNTFTHNGTSDLGYAVANYVPSTEGTATVTCNWFGTAVATEIADNSSMTGKIFNKSGCETEFLPFLITDDILSPDCSGLGPVVVYEGSGPTIRGSYMSIQEAIDAASTVDGDVVEVGVTDFTEPGLVRITKSLTVQGLGKTATTVRCNVNTASGGHDNDDAAWILGSAGETIVLKDMTLDATGKDVAYAVRFRDSGEVNGVAINEVKHSASQYYGVAIQVLDGNVDVLNCSFTEIGRIGVHFRNGVISGASISGLYEGNEYTGKGDGDWLDYALDISGGTTVTVRNSKVTENTGEALSDGSTSAGVMATTYYPAGQNLANDVTIENCILTGNYDGIVVGYDANDVSVVVANYNDLSGNTNSGASSTAPTVDASGNWWGDTDPTDNFTGSVDYTPWLRYSTDTSTDVGFQPDLSYLYVDDNSPQVPSTGRIQEGINMVSGSTVSVKAGTYNEKITINKSLDLLGDDGAVLDGTGLGNVTGVSIKSGDVTFDNFTVENFGGNGIIVGYEATPPGDLHNVVITNNVVHNIHPGSSHGFGLYVGYEAEGFPGTISAHLQYDGLVICGNTIYDTQQAALVLQSITASSGMLEVYDNDIHTTSYSAIWIDTARKLDIHDNKLHDCGNGIYISAIADGWYVADGTYGPKDIEIYDNIISDNSNFGIVTYAGWMGDIDVNYNYISGNTTGFHNYVSALIDATNNYWGDPTGPKDTKSVPPGIPPYNNPGGLGDPVSAYVEYDPWLTGNIVWDPDPATIKTDGGSVTIAVKYLGGGSAPLYGYDIPFSWDESIATADVGDVTQGDLFAAGSGSSQFYATKVGNTIQVNSSLLGDVPGEDGPGTLFTVTFTEANPGFTDLTFGTIQTRDKNNADITGIDSDDGLLIVDLAAPTVSVEIENTTLAFTNDYIKNGDNAQVTATITEDGELTVDDITADLSPFGGGTAVHPDPGDLSYDPVDEEWTATWDIAGVTCNPSNGTLTITVTVEDMGGNVATGSDDITADNTPPGAVTGLVSNCGHKKVYLSWDGDTSYEGVIIRYEYWRVYPRYDGAEPTYPGSHTAGDGSAKPGATPLDQMISGATSYVHTFDPDQRSIYYYTAFAVDKAGNIGTTTDPSGGSSDRSTNYYLADLGSGYGSIPGSGYDGYVDFDDISFFSGLYWKKETNDGTNEVSDAEAEANFGPSIPNKTYGARHRLAVPDPNADNVIAFEDMMILSMNYEVVSPKAGSKDKGRIEDHFALELKGTIVEKGEQDELMVTVYLANDGAEVKGASVKLNFDGECLKLNRIEKGRLFGASEQTAFFKSRAKENWLQVDASILGKQTIVDYSGTLATLYFTILDAEKAEIKFESFTVRDGENNDLTVSVANMSVADVLPPETFDMAQNYPNPFNPETTIKYQLPEPCHVELVIYNARGQKVRTLVNALREAGRYEAVWNGVDDSEQPVSSGMYYYRINAGDYKKLLKMVFLK